MENIACKLLILLSTVIVSRYCKASRFCDGLSSPKFRETLVDQTVKSGQNVAFTCSVSNFDMTSDEITWQIRPDMYRKVINIGTITHDVYASSITLYDIGQTSVHISCILKWPIHQDQPASDSCHLVSSATLLVEYFPDVTDLTCSPEGPFAMRAGDILSVRCEVPRCEPAVDLSWTLSSQGQRYLPLPSITDVGLARVLREDLAIDQSLHLNSVICLVSSEFAFPNEKLECTIGPIRVLSPPSVSLQPQYINVSVGEPFAINCFTNGYPEVTYYFWTCSPNSILIGCNSSFPNTSMTAIKGLSDDTIDVVVRCTATNMEGSASGFSIVKVLPHAFVEPSNELEEGSYTVQISVVESGYQCCLRLLCSLSANVSDDDKIEFIWIIDGQHFGEEDKAVGKELPGKSLFTFHNNLELNGSTLVTCKIKVDLDTFESSQNVSVCLTNDTEVLSDHPVVSWQSNLLNVTTRAYVRNTNEEMHSRTPRSNYASSDTEALQSALHIHTRKLASIVAGTVVGFIFITIGCVAMVAVFLFRHFRNRSTSMPMAKGTSDDMTTTNKPEESGRLPESKVDSDMIYDMYEIPHPEIPRMSPPSGSSSLDDNSFHSSSSSVCSSYEYETSPSDCSVDDNTMIETQN